MRKLADEEAAKYQKLFSRYIKAGVTPDNIEGLYKKAHQAIRTNPDRVADPSKKSKAQYKSDAAKYRPKKLNLQQRKERIAEKKARFISDAQVHAQEEVEEE